MIVDSGAPVSLMSSAWLKNYLKEEKVDPSEVERSEIQIWKNAVCKFRENQVSSSHENEHG